jgi:diguanylate cyclase (GGDEF)-like protein
MFQPWMNQSTGDIQSEMASLRRKDGALWKFSGFMVIAVSLAFLVLVVPNLISRNEIISINVKDLPQLSVALLCVVALFGIQASRQRREITLMRDALFRRLLMDERRSDGILDPETQTYSSVMLQSVLERMTPEVSSDSPLSILDVQIQALASVRRRNGDQAVDHLVRSLAEILRSSLRGSDRIFKSGEGGFYVVMPNTAGDRAEIPIRRIIQAVDRWNSAMNVLEYRLNIAVGKVTSTSSKRSGMELLSDAKQQRTSASEIFLPTPATA